MKSQKLSNAILINVVLGLIVLLWLVPVIGIFASSFRDRFDILTTPWWHILPHRDWVATRTINPRELGLDPSGPMTVEGITATFEEMRAGVEQ
jgi:alpha-glucoside transport system permease protein